MFFFLLPTSIDKRICLVEASLRKDPHSEDGVPFAQNLIESRITLTCQSPVVFRSLTNADFREL